MVSYMHSRLAAIFFFLKFWKVTETPLQRVRLVAKANPAKFQWNRLIFSAASSPLKFIMFGIKVSIALQLENRSVIYIEYIERL